MFVNVMLINCCVLSCVVYLMMVVSIGCMVYLVLFGLFLLLVVVNCDNF